ncbi:hypothetical protein, partial [Pseudomonas corrugata]|uniref:hypothetical protein n=1 Tax=Pseudomonas corrugata TaxID=47879 RepID=UPI00370978DA
GAAVQPSGDESPRHRAARSLFSVYSIVLAKPTMLPIPRHRIRNGLFQIPEAQPQHLLALARVETENLWEQSLLAIAVSQSVSSDVDWFAVIASKLCSHRFVA